ncbi:hypothetical protein BGX28_008417 [Mortierella sp. GBA30]|nr:hypothetical protein BGX28_008417 [Mortierella sp. GBA30]
MPFPNLATHRRMPHLHNTPKQPTQQAAQDQQQQQQVQQQQEHHPTFANQNQDSTSPQLRLTAGSSGSQRLLEDGQANTHTDSLSSHSLLANSTPGVVTQALQDSDAANGSHSTVDESVRLSSRGMNELAVPSSHSRPTSPLGTRSPSATSPAMSSHDSKLIKTALHDAFGVLYHPSAHTKHSLSTTAAALRSGDVTPLMGLSPKGSPLLRPNMGPSAPITPLELADELTTQGYFTLHPPTSSTGAITGSPNNSHNHHHSHHRHTHTASHLSATYTNGDQEELEHGRRTPFSMSRRSSIDTMVLNPVEHPVLSSLQTLSITHPHPPEHYHPHLGHDLGHDRIPIENSTTSIEHQPKTAVTNAASSTTTVPPSFSVVKAPSEVVERPRLDSSLPRSLPNHVAPPPSSPFPMDQGDRDSILSMGHQGLV